MTRILATSISDPASGADFRRPPGALWDRSQSLSYARHRCHQQYLYKVHGGYCPDHGTGVSCPIGVVKADAVGLLKADG